MSFSREDSRWEIDATYPTAEKCDSSGKYIGDRYGRTKDGPLVRDGRVVALLGTRFLCLPDTVDPRGPKGK